MKKWPLIVPFLLLSFFYLLFFFQKTNLAASDLGRHIMNGKIIMATGKVFSNNLYSYTNADYFVPNHHWLFGVIVFYGELATGFGGLTFFSGLLYAGAVALVLWHVGKKYGKTAMVLAGLLVLPLITARVEVRPEAFSLFFFALELVVLLWWQEKKLKWWWVAVIFFVISVLWVNIHIFFMLQFLLLGAFGLQVLVQKNWRAVGEVCGCGVATVLGILCNPLGFQGAIYPFQILGDYGYRVSENQSPLFFLQHFPSLYYWYMAGFFLVSVVLILWAFKAVGLKKEFFKNIASLILFVALLVLTNKLVRFGNFFGLVAIIPLSFAIQQLRKKYPLNWKELSQNVVFLSLGSLIGFALLVFVVASGIFMPFRQMYGFGLTPRMNNSAEFFKRLPIKGAIFNNFDIGSYLVYHLYPSKQVFVDNRAEAYPSAFLQEYIEAQQNSEVWKKLDEKYQFGAIYFYRRENTNWGQEFLVATLERPEWVPIYVDNYIIIFIKDKPEHAELVKRHRLPKEIFGVTKF